MNFLCKNFDWHTNEYPQIIYNGIEIEKFQVKIDKKSKKSEEHLRNKYNIIVVGHIGLQKNPHFTLEIFHNIVSRRNDVDLIWIGKGEMENEIREKAKEYGINDRIHFLGHRKDIPEMLQISDVFLFPSLFEGLGIAMIEAQASGIPCIASTTVPTLADCGGVVFLKLSDPISKWADTIESILDKRINFHIDKSKLEKFSIANMTLQMEKVLSI